MTTSALILDSYRPSDWDAFAAWLGASEAFGPILEEASLGDSPRQVFQALVTPQPASGKDLIVWAVRLGDTGELIGHVELKRRALAAGCEYELVYIVRAEHRGKGYASEAAALAVARAFRRGVCHRIVACVDERNLQSLRVVQKAGFRPDEALGSDGGVVWYSISDRDGAPPDR